MGVSEVTVPLATPGGSAGFASHHKADAIFFPCLLAFIWAGLLFGFVPEIHRHIVQHKPPYLWIVHLHAVVFVGWMVLLTTQLSLVRSRNLALHKRLGPIAFYWGPVLVVVGLVTAVMVDRSRFGTPNWDPQFLSVELGDLINFAILLAFALRMRGNSAVHKRLMLLAVTALGNAGFARWWGDALESWLGQGYAAQVAQEYLGDFVIIVTLMTYDFITRGRPNRAVIMGGALIVGVELFAIYLYLAPWWITFTDKLLHP
ncbi:MAG TPA: hypothetical protein VGY49_12055 [Burkholderiaceae bacterium]|jgi:hypothetical protein|nr:hypothetical protein [Burkholderiaceae bacterium]